MNKEIVARGLEPLLEQIAAKEAEVLRLKEVANAYATTLGGDAPFPDAQGPTSAVKRDAIRPDQFAAHGAPSAATRAFFEWRGKDKGAATLDEIFDALQRGGYAFENHRNVDESKAGLKVALGKDAQVHKLSNGYYGLNVWYGKRDKTRPSKEHAKNDKAANIPNMFDEADDAQDDAEDGSRGTA